MWNVVHPPVAGSIPALATVGLLVVAATPAAQRQFEELRAPGLVQTHGASRSLAVGDVDADGDLDIVIGITAPSTTAQNRLLLNDGFGSFHDATSTHMPPDFSSTRSVALGDVDSDGDLDIVFGNSFAVDCLYLNDGTGVFTDETSLRMPANAFASEDVVLADVDGDGKLDLVIASSSCPNHLYLNDGTGFFTDVTATNFPTDTDSSFGLALGDIDGDGDLDVAIANGYSFAQQNRLYLNDGSGTFADVTPSHMPAHVETTTGACMADVDSDGDLELILINPTGQNRLYENDSTGVLTDVTAGRLPIEGGTSLDLAIGDVEGDGDLDLVVASGRHSPEQNRLYVNDGSGAFIDATARLPPMVDDCSAAVLADLDGDGDPDILFGTEDPYQDRLYTNLRRQLELPQPPRVGQNLVLTAHARHGPASTLDVALPFVSAATSSVFVPPIGTFGLDPAQTVALPPFVIGSTTGSGSTVIPLPNRPMFVGFPMFAQALVLRYPAEGTLTNVTRDVITP